MNSIVNESCEYPYSFILPIERNFDPNAAKNWMNNIWYLGFYYSAAYIIIIFAIKKVMTNLKPFKLNMLLLMWNIMLSVFSIFCFARTAPELINTLVRKGLYGSVCNASSLDEEVSSLWSFLFMLSKLPEFGDTIFIVLRKQPLIFLHWYHHILTLIYSWYAYKEWTSSSRWFIVMNSLIHSFMYTYYACRALKIRIPKQISVFVTSSQILQMVIGCYINYKTWWYLSSKIPCGVKIENVFISLFMYFSYFILFSHFFYKSYLSKKMSSASPTEKKTQ